MIGIRSGAPLESSYSAGCPYTCHCRLPRKGRDHHQRWLDLTRNLALSPTLISFLQFTSWSDISDLDMKGMITKVKHVFKYSQAIVSQTGSRWHTVDPKWGWCPIKKWQRDNGTWWPSFFVLIFPDFSQNILKIFALEVVVGLHISVCTPFAKNGLIFSPTFISDHTSLLSCLKFQNWFIWYICMKMVVLTGADNDKDVNTGWTGCTKMTHC